MQSENKGLFTKIFETVDLHMQITQKPKKVDLAHRNFKSKSKFIDKNCKISPHKG